LEGICYWNKQGGCIPWRTWGGRWLRNQTHHKRKDCFCEIHKENWSYLRWTNP
jgi:hypothetical protein